MKIKLIELFSGIGGFTKGLQDAGFEIEEHYFSEIDKHAIANYKYNFPHAKYIGDVKSIQSGDFTGIDIITFGSPCQDFSLAGKRKGLEGSRSSLIQYAIDLVTNIRPSVFIWENVKGAFSSNSGADFWAIIQAFANIGGYRLEWQLLNTKWLLPQNRERIYLIGHLDGRSKPGVFPFTEDNKFNNTTGEIKEKIHITAQTLTAGDFKSQRGNFIQIGAIRGRNPENPKSRQSGLFTEQMLEINENGCSNTLTSVQKDNVVVGTWRTHNDSKGFRKISDDNCPTIPARARQDGSGQPVISYSMGSSKLGRSCINSGRVPEIGDEQRSIRRLTEIECERLQGFPDNWTQFGVYEKQVWINKKQGTFKIIEGIKEIPKTQRYKQLGNAVTATIVMQIGLRLKKLMN